MNDKVRILVVDDEDVVRRCYVRTLASERCVVETASNGFEALHGCKISASMSCCSTCACPAWVA
ncbi:MAG: hypothetical protein IPP44_28650 [Ideonella sp.]|nr:hypothetical protein [Ideonella sp.]